MNFRSGGAQRIGSTRLDPSHAKALDKALRLLPAKLRGKAITKAQKEAMKPALDNVKEKSKTISRSGSMAKSIHVVTGKYARRGRPYVIMKSRNKTEDLEPMTLGMDRQIDRGKRNWARVAHFGILGVKPTLKAAGSSKGRPSKGRAFVFFDPDKGGGMGDIVVVKKIKHSGNLGYPLYDRAMQSSSRAVESKFRDGVDDILDDFFSKLKTK